MAKFAFYFGSDPTTASRMQLACEALWGQVYAYHSDRFHLFVATDHSLKGFCETPKVVGFVSGYARRDGLPLSPTKSQPNWLYIHNSHFLEEVVNNQVWPLDDNWTGSFAALGFDKERKILVICNDLIGYRPIYIRQLPNGIIGSSSLILISHCCECQPDVVGILQRITPPYFCNYGRRTLLSGVWRPLPGEWIRFESPNALPESRFDNSLCREILDGDIKLIARKVWDCLQQEVAIAVGSSTSVAVALSGGWDSRLILAAVANLGIQIQCYTYGQDDLYEVQIAKRCADAVGASHLTFNIENKYFPHRNQFEQLVKTTESANCMEWNAILEEVNLISDNFPNILLLGDMTESIQGRNILMFSSRKSRISLFLKGFIGKGNYFEITTQNQTEAWCNNLKRKLIDQICAMQSRLSSALASRITPDEIKENLENDISLSLSIVLIHKPTFLCMLDEIFLWLHKSRYLLASQDLLLESHFTTLNPSMSLRFLRLISSVHPRLRLRLRLMDAIMRLPELKNLACIPIAYIPWVSARAPLFIKEIVWGLRSTIDQILIRRMLRAKNPNLRQRVVKSLDYVAEYRRSETIENVKSWFSGHWIKPDYYIEICKKRAELRAWPLINLDITAPANVSILLDLCRFQ